MAGDKGGGSETVGCCCGGDTGGGSGGDVGSAAMGFQGSLELEFWGGGGGGRGGEGGMVEAEPPMVKVLPEPVWP